MSFVIELILDLIKLITSKLVRINQGHTTPLSS